MSNRIVIIGAGGVGREIAATLMHANFKDIEVVGFVDDTVKQGSAIHLLQVLGNIDWLIAKRGSQDYGLVIAIGNPKIRRDIIERIGEGFDYPTIIHPNVSIHNNGRVKIGKGCYIGDGCIMTTDITIEDFCFINTGCSLQHDTILKMNSVLMPGVRITGGATIGRHSLIGANCVITKAIEINEGSTIFESII